MGLFAWTYACMGFRLGEKMDFFALIKNPNPAQMYYPRTGYPLKNQYHNKERTRAGNWVHNYIVRVSNCTSFLCVSGEESSDQQHSVPFSPLTGEHLYVLSFGEAECNL